MKKGFTLIELLAVIVILAVIALIATPIIINLIEDAKKNSAINSAKLYVDGLSKFIVKENIYHGFMPSSCTVGETVTCDGAPFSYNVSGKKPTSGTVSYSNGVVTGYDICIMNYRVLKNGNSITAQKSDECGSGSTEPPEEILVYDGTSVSTDLEGCGTEDSPYLISSPEDLIYMRNQVNSGGNITTSSTCSSATALASEAYYLQTVGIALNDTTNYSSWTSSTTGLYSWTPIGIQVSDPYTVYAFAGHYDGGNHSISGIYISNEDSYQALFGYTNSVSVSNLKINKSYINAGYAASMLIGYMTRGNSSVSNIDVQANLVSPSGGDTGGVIGAIYITDGTGNISISNINVTGSISGTYAVGSIIGYYYSGNEQLITITSATNSANIIGLTGEYASSKAGGLVGYGYTMPITISNSVNNGNITGFNDAGGIIAGCSNCATTITATVNHGNITNDGMGDDGLGGIYGYGSSTSLVLSNVYNDGNITGTTYVGGLIGNQISGSSVLAQVHNSGTLTLNSNSYSGTSYEGGLAGYLYGTTTLAASYNTGNFTANMEDHIYSGGLIGYSATGVRLSESYNIGRISITTTGKNVRVGGLIGNMGSPISGYVLANAYNTGDISVTGSNSSYVSGLFGYISSASDSHIENMYNTGDITYSTSYGADYETHYISGIAYSEMNVNNVYNTGNINVTNTGTYEKFKVAGLVNTYWGNNSVQDSYFKGVITTSISSSKVGSIGTYYKDTSTGNVYNSSNNYLPFLYSVVDYSEVPLTNAQGGTSQAASSMPTILSIVNGSNKFKADSGNINNGNPILSWQ